MAAQRHFSDPAETALTNDLQKLGRQARRLALWEVLSALPRNPGDLILAGVDLPVDCAV